MALIPARDLQRGFKALVDELGYAGALRFIVSFEQGRGDSVKEIRALRAGKSLPTPCRRSRRPNGNGGRSH